ncbi:molybdopterin molybdotransferase MoeA [Erythrobacter tepidarius]|uniref:molybdopterin molybdotransferase MoeA n=1 Tax=Erythrobacter tepidarius TaxID=60454 RepID=UPI000A3C3599|nr:molybdopterin molybdotransferase MoeA [Erythrobacter tepidarius]
MSALPSLEEAQERLLALAPQPQVTMLGLSQATTKGYLAQDIVALRSQPAANLSAMDGYAISGPGPWRKVGESRAGAPFSGTLASGECVRISTGAVVPEGACSILIQENAMVDGDTLATAPGEQPPPAGRHFRRAGFDFRKGDIVLHKGTPLTPATVALAISAGHKALPIVARPSVAVLDCGDELVPVGDPAAVHQIPASNGVMLSWMLAPYIGEVDAILGPVADDPAALAMALRRAENCDILVTSGGASVGEHDLVRQALGDWGATIDFWKVALKPGKPLMVATRPRENGRLQIILGLPGNPVSSFVTAFLFALPLVRAALGAADPLPRAVTMKAGEALPATQKRREFLRGVCDGTSVRLAGSQDSSALGALAAADCLIDRLPDSPALAAGEPVRVFLLREG